MISKQNEHLIFDLDNTLFDEFSFILPIAKSVLSEQSKIHDSERDKIEEQIKKQYSYNGNIKLFSEALKNTSIDIVTFINDYKRKARGEFVFQNKLCLYPWVFDLLHMLNKFNKPLNIITNGHPYQQKFKVHQLNLRSLYPNSIIIFANQFTPKPSPHSFIENFDVMDNNYTYIGDSKTDMQFAFKSSIDYVDVNDFKRDLYLYLNSLK